MSNNIATRLGAGFAIGSSGAALGGIGCFLAGFFGPIVFFPSANQGPLLGIFILGPVGAVLGGLLGFFAVVARTTPRTGALLGILLGATLSSLFYDPAHIGWWLFILAAGSATFGSTGALSSAVGLRSARRS